MAEHRAIAGMKRTKDIVRMGKKACKEITRGEKEDVEEKEREMQIRREKCKRERRGERKTKQIVQSI